VLFKEIIWPKMAPAIVLLLVVLVGALAVALGVPQLIPGLAGTP